MRNILTHPTLMTRQLDLFVHFTLRYNLDTTPISFSNLLSLGNNWNSLHEHVYGLKEMQRYFQIFLFSYQLFSQELSDNNVTSVCYSKGSSMCYWSLALWLEPEVCTLCAFIKCVDTEILGSMSFLVLKTQNQIKIFPQQQHLSDCRIHLRSTVSCFYLFIYVFALFLVKFKSSFVCFYSLCSSMFGDTGGNM